jgi:hypothetical protein
VPDQQLSDLTMHNAASSGESGSGGQVGRDPDAIQREIEETRAELARTVDLIADRLSPKRAASRGASKVKSSIDGVFHREESDGLPAGHTETHMPHGEPGSPSYDSGIRTVPLAEPGADTPIVRTLRTDRVAGVAAAVVAVVALIVWRRRRKH